jgi:exopolyphosphatase / guanosine-5'-triphosphate,3'-diphosphate pyrophosphatase
MRVAGVDCGTNSIRLLVADISDGRLTDVDRRLEIVRLGQDVDRTGRLAPEALARTFEACKRYAARIGDLGAERVRFVATSATRDASNRDEFFDGVRTILGVEPEVITGDEEARLSFDGATRELAALGVPAPYLVIDIGGGSTEFVLGTDQPEQAISVDMGCVRLTERHLVSDPPTALSITAAREEVDRLIDKVSLTVELGRAKTLVALAGTATTVSAMAMDLPAYIPERIHLSRISVGDIRSIAERFLAMPHAERAALPFMHPGRVDVIGGGSLILERIATRVEPYLSGENVVISEHDILDGIAFSLSD